MKVKLQSELGFKPLDIVFTIESEKEGKAFYCLFNYAPLVDFIDYYLGNDFSDKVRAIMDGKGLSTECGDTMWGKLLDSMKKLEV